MIRYKNTQFGWVVVAVCLLVGSVLLIVSISNKNIEHLKGGFLLGAFIVFSCVLLFNSLTTIVTDEYVKVYFGSGLIQRKIYLSQIIEAKAIQNSFVLGWGIRLGVGFVMWNVSGFQSIELTLKNKNWKFRIGTDKPDELFHAIESAIKEQQLSVKVD